MHIPKWLIAAAGLLLVALIAAVAFFIGRGSSQPLEAPIAVSLQEPASVREPAPDPTPPVAEASGGAMTSQIAASTNGTAAIEAPSFTAGASQPITSAPAEARARVADYFKQMDSLQSGEAVANPEAFAATLLQGAVSGDFSGIDGLVRAAGDAERRAVALQPPGECAEYHRMAVTLLQESKTMVTALRDGLKRNDTDALSSVGASAQSMRSRTDALAAAEKALRARYGL